MRREDIIELIKRFSGQANILTIPRIYIDLTDGDHLAAMFLNQCVYWTDRSIDPQGWFHKSAREWEEELALSYYQVRRVAEVCTPWVVSKIGNVNNSQTTFYRANGDAIAESILKKLHIEETSICPPILKKLEYAHSRNLSVHAKETSISTNTKINSEITQETIKVSSEKISQKDLEDHRLILQQLRVSEEPVIYDRFIAGLRLVGIGDDHVVLGCDDKDKLKWLENRLTKTLERFWSGQCARAMRVIWRGPEE